jgi:lysophospholipase L1-like esterase
MMAAREGVIRVRPSSVLLSLALAACAPIAAEAQAVRVLGRSAGDASDFSVQWPASGFQAKFSGPAFSAKIEDSGDTTYEIDVDGAVRVLDLDKGVKTYTLFQGAAGEHVITVTRRTGTNSGPTQFSAFKADGRIAPTPAPARRLMVIGDSISTGYGVGGADHKCSFTYPTEIATDTYAAIAARAFGADLQVQAIDGFGLAKNWDGSATTMRQASWRALPWQEARVNPSAWQPQAIVLNLGTNDFSVGIDGGSFTAAYEAFLKELRAAYPDAAIFAASGPMLNAGQLDAMRNATRAAVKGRADAGDKRVEYLAFSLATAGRIYGCDWHPGRDTQKGMALALNSAITRVLGWSSSPAGGAASGRPQ